MIESNPNTGNQDQVRIILPEERLAAVDLSIEDIPYVAVLNCGLIGFEHKGAFGWYLSLIIDYDKTEGEGMPDDENVNKMQLFSDCLTSGLSGNPTHPNALFLGRVTGNNYTEIMWYVNNPIIADEYLKRLISSSNHPFEFDYEITPDSQWREAEYWLSPFE